MAPFDLAQFAEDGPALRVLLALGEGAVHGNAIHLQRPVMLQLIDQAPIAFLLWRRTTRRRRSFLHWLVPVFAFKEGGLGWRGFGPKALAVSRWGRFV